MLERAFPAVAKTDEATWISWATRLPRLRTATAGAVVVVAPHPDDETLACGGLIADLCRRGVPVQVVAVTDGEESHSHIADLGRRRRAEQAAALSRLGVTAETVRLALVDSGVAVAADELRAGLERAVGPGDLLIAPWSRDGHSDHDACGASAAAVACAVGCRLVVYPVWAWQWARPDDFDGGMWRTYVMSEGAYAAKLGAIECYSSQTTGLLGDVIVDENMLVRFHRRFEVFGDVD